MTFSPTPTAARENGIFNSLPAEDYALLLPHLETVSLPAGRNIYAYGDDIGYVYFLLDAVVYLFLTMKDGATVEAGVVGAEGVLGVSVFMGDKTARCQAVVLSPSRALRVKADIIKRAFDGGGHLHDRILHFINGFYVQASQTAACNHIHPLAERLCRWLLLLHDRVKSDKITVTQEFIAQMLGTRRPYITTAAGRLQKEAIIRCTRGHIEILDRRRLEARSCECYATIQEVLSAPVGKKSSFVSDKRQASAVRPEFRSVPTLKRPAKIIFD